jgi:hypothetical protein
MKKYDITVWVLVGLMFAVVIFRGQTVAYPADVEFDTDHVVLNMTGGPCCGGNTSNAQIHFRCVPGSLGVPTLLQNINNCSFMFDWPSSAACPIQDDFGEGCQVYDGNLGYGFDLTSLMQSDDYT